MNNSLALPIVAVLAAVLPVSASPAAAQPPSPTSQSVVNPVLKVHDKNRRYFMLSNPCEAIYMAGTHHRANLQDIGATYPPSAFNFAGIYPPADAPRANFIRGWHWEHSRWEDAESDNWVLPLPFARTGSDNANDSRLQFNLTQYDGSYVSRLQSRASTAAGEGMFLSIMFFNGFSVEDRGQGQSFTYVNHPFNSQNNVNGVNGDWTAAYPQGGEMHSQVAGKPPAVTTNQDNYVRHIVASLNGHENILWEVSNESHSGSLSWQNYIAGVIRNRETTLTKRHLVWISVPRDVTNVALYNSVADVISPSWGKLAVTATGGTGGAGTLYQTDPPVTSGAKIVILDTDHLDADCSWCNRSWVWKAFTRGYHIALLDDGQGNVPQRQQVRDAIDDTVAYSKRINLIDMAPQSESQSTPCSTRYCLYTSNDPDPQPFAPAVPNGKQYLVFKPSTTTSGTPTSEVTISSLPAGDFGGEWFRVSDGNVRPVPLFTHGGGNLVLTSPYGTSEAVLYLMKSGPTFICA